MTIRELCTRIDSILSDTPDGEFDGMCILEDIGGISRERAAIHSDDCIADGVCGKILDAARRRAAGYPLQYILGKWEFYGLPFYVGEGVLIPRPDTETLVDETLKRLSAMDGLINVIDLCSGSGCIAVSLAKNLGDKGQVFAVELSGEAFPYLVKNVRENNVNVRMLRGDVMNGGLMENFRDDDNEGEYLKIDCIVSNPPYLTDDEMDSLQKEVTFEPQSALYGGNDGLKFYRVISCLWKELLRDNGLLIFEIGTEQEDDVRQILSDNGFKDIFTAADATGGVRVIGGYKAEIADMP